MSIDALPQVPVTALPPSVRKGDREAYRAALGFEQVLLGQLVQEMLPEGEMRDGPYATSMQEAFTGGLVAAGGIGLAASLYPSLKKDAT